LTTNAPEHPSLPIYESFTSAQDFGYVGRSKRGVEPNGRRRLRRVAGVADIRARSARDSLAPTPTKAPVYDRSAELAKIYQSVMPDFDAMFEGDDDESAETEKVKHRPVQRQQDAIDFDTTQPPPFKEKSEKKKTRPLKTHPMPSLDQAQSGFSTTSLTMIENNDFVDAPTHYAAPANETSLRPRSRSSPWSFGVAPSTPDPSSEAHARDVAPVSTISTRARAVSEPHAERRHRYLGSQRDSIVLQVCTEMLVEQLTGAFAWQRHGRHLWPINGDGKEAEECDDGFESSLTQMQLLLMIEAYEEVLESCKQETLLSQLWQSAFEADGSGSAGQSGDAERGAAREAVPILEHWLATLKVMYEELTEANGNWI
jgi:hypothetical protein